MTKAINKTKEKSFNSDDPDNLIDDVICEFNKDKKYKTVSDLPKKTQEKYIHYKLSQSLENLCLETDPIKQEYKAYYIQLVKDLISEYKITKPSEKLLVNTIALSYIRIIQYSNRVQQTFHIEYLSTVKNGYYSILSKEQDRAYKQYIELMRLLIQMKAKPINVNIKAQNAIIGQNQQFNTLLKDNLLKENH